MLGSAFLFVLLFTTGCVSAPVSYSPPPHRHYYYPRTIVVREYYQPYPFMFNWHVNVGHSHLHRRHR